MDEQVTATPTETVTMSIPEEKVVVTTSSAEEQQPEVLQEIHEALNTIEKITCQTEGCKQEFQTVEGFEKHQLEMHLKEIKSIETAKPQRNEKGHFLQGNKEAEGLTNSGRPCEFCQRPVEIMSKVNLYREFCRGKVDGKPHIPYIQELVSEEYLDITIDQFEDWVNPANHKEQHAELTRTYRKLMTRQQHYLLRATLSDRYRGAMFQLSANHGMMEQSKQLQGGIKGGDPLEYNIHIVPKKKREEIDE